MPEEMEIGTVKKLIPNLCDKDKYGVDIQRLDQALKHNLVLKKVHRVISFQQIAWFRVYIDKNTELKKKAKNNFKKDFFKLIKNSVYGKTMEIVRKQKDMRLVTDETSCKKLVMKPNFKDGKVQNQNDKAVVPWLTHTGTEQDSDVRFELQLHAAKVQQG